MNNTLRIMLCLAVILSMAIPAFAAPEEGKLVTVAQVDEGQRVWGVGISYTRIIELQHSGEHNGTLLATYEYATSGLRHEKPGYNIHRSTDGGSTWEMISVVRERGPILQSEWMPFLFELPCQIGSMPAGTVLLAACSIDHTQKEQNALRIYRSYDQGETWEQYSNIISIRGGVGYWEPFLMVLPDGRLAVHYSDITESAEHSQKLVMKISEDGVNWGETIDVVALEDRVMRPGMSIITQMNDGRFVLVYEMCEENNPDCGNAIHYRFSSD
ncbi:MAG: exo-alpha-sialidase, partial [Clostridiales bacterium]|nr:exo-alpha-sialidase [Clostridiales bacterium]